MAVFADYARYYDLLYRDKDYVGEADYIATLLHRFHPEGVKLVELGSGTGKHAALLTEKHYSVHGIELSQEMLSQAEELTGQHKGLAFSQGDIRSARLNSKFDAAISLFHVMSYQTTNSDLVDAFRTARAHLDLGGIFIFDCWYGPSVLTERPAVRVKRVSDDSIEITRLVEPVLHPNLNLVEVNYQVFVRDKATDSVSEIHETHRMRYLFQPEIEMHLGQAGFNLLHTEEWMTGKPIGCDTWGACFIAQVA